MYKTFSRKQMQVMTWWAHPTISKQYNAVICDGSIRAGKTLSMSTSFLLWAMTKFDGCSFAICGKTVSSCRRNVVTPLLTEMAGEMQCEDRVSKNYLEISHQGRSNRFYIFGGKDESSAALIQGVTLAGVLFDEVALMPQSFVEPATARCSVDGSTFWFNCNPEHPFHWFYLEWICKRDEKKALYLHFTMDDNPSLSQEIRERYGGMYSGVFYDRFIRGKWVVARGRVYPMFSEDFHVVRTEPRPYDRYVISIDYGTVNPFSAGLWGRCGGRWYRVAEYYWDSRATNIQRTDEEHYIELEKLAGRHPIDRVVIDPSAASFIQCIRRHGKFMAKQAVNDVMFGVNRVAQRLQDGTLRINDCCKDIRREFAVYSWDDKALEDKPLKEHDHTMDDMRYFVATVIDPPGGLRIGGI